MSSQRHVKCEPSPAWIVYVIAEITSASTGDRMQPYAVPVSQMAPFTAYLTMLQLGTAPLCLFLCLEAAQL